MTAPSAKPDETAGLQPVGSISCRLCDGTAIDMFGLELIGKHQVRFYRCRSCGSLQSEQPYWLEEAYSNSNLARLDTGAVQRNLNNLAALYAWVRLTGTRTVIDIGGGDGLLCRLLRDYGIAARPEDRYASNAYAQGFEDDPVQAPTLCAAFEVFEHYARPKSDLDMIFGKRPDSVVVTTALYDGQGAEWWYLTPSSGQHVFFYTRDAMAKIGHNYGYHVYFIGNYTIFTLRPVTGITKLAARISMNNVGVRVIRSLLMLLPARGAVRDFERIAPHR